MIRRIARRRQSRAGARDAVRVARLCCETSGGIENREAAGGTMPLSGVRVVELAQIIAGPLVGEILAEFGANVIKVERPEGGDDSRNWTPPVWLGASPLYNTNNRSKRSVTVDITVAAERDRLIELVRTADIFIQNLRPGVADRFGLGPEALTRINPRLIYCEVGAFGHKGPKREDPGFEILFQAWSGLMHSTGEPDRDPVRMGAPLCDMGTAMWTAMSAIAALRGRDRTGRGCVINTSLLETSMFYMNTHYAHWRAGGGVPKRHPTGSPRVIVFQGFDTSSGRIIVAAANDRLFAKFAAALGRPEWGSDPRYATNADRVANKDVLLAAIQDIMAGGTKEHWMAVLEAAGVPCAPVHDLAEAVADEQVRALGIVQSAPDLDDNADFVTLPVSFDGVRPPIRRRPPRLGEHNEEVFGGGDPWMDGDVR